MNKLLYIYTLTATLLLGTLTGVAQSRLSFDETSYSFGTIREDGGKVSHTFRYSNTGDEPIVILSATTTCGCTVAAYDRKPVMPGRKGEIAITFDPMYRPGAFAKNINVYTSEKTKPICLQVSGDVTARERSVEELYPIYVGEGVRLDDNFHAFAYVEHGKTTRSALKYANTSDKAVRVRLEPEKSSGVLQLDYPAVIPAGARGDIDISYGLPATSRVYGTLHDMMRVYVDGKRTETLISITGIAVDNRDRVTDKSIPKAELTKNIVKFGAVKHDDGESVGHFGITNTGSAPLNIRAVEVSVPEIRVSISGGERIAAGSTLDVEVRMRCPAERHGAFVGRVRIITDDPARPMREMRVTAIIED